MEFCDYTNLNNDASCILLELSLKSGWGPLTHLFGISFRHKGTVFWGNLKSFKENYHEGYGLFFSHNL